MSNFIKRLMPLYTIKSEIHFRNINSIFILIKMYKYNLNINNSAMYDYVIFLNIIILNRIINLNVFIFYNIDKWI